jgi:hypothetical protein
MAFSTSVKSVNIVFMYNVYSYGPNFRCSEGNLSLPEKTKIFQIEMCKNKTVCGGKNGVEKYSLFF